MALHTTSPDYDTLLNDISVQFANSQLSRRASRTSNSSQPRRSVRVEKPRSANPSPKMLERRKTTATSSKRYTSLDDHFNMMFGTQSSGTAEEPIPERRPQSRPLSWHPSSMNVFSDAFISSDDIYRHSPNWSQFQSGLFYSNTSPAASTGYIATPDWSQAPTNDMTAAPYPCLPQENMHQMQHLPSKQSSTNILPIQHHSDLEDTDMSSGSDDSSEDDKDLVGMGLYDPPEGFSCLTAGFVESTGKGLKLEETWQPPEQEEGDEDAEDDASADEEEVEEPPAPVKEDKPWSTVSAGLHFPSNINGQEFFFEEDQNFADECWFHQLKEPVAVQHTGIGFGWF